VISLGANPILAYSVRSTTVNLDWQRSPPSTWGHAYNVVVNPLVLAHAAHPKRRRPVIIGSCIFSVRS
jgi:hypothetical protein